MTTQLDHYRLLGRSGLRVSPLSLGTMTFGAQGWGTDMDEATRMFNRYVELGGNFIDTANFYAQGQSEVMLGQLIQAQRQQRGRQPVRHPAHGANQCDHAGP